MTYDPGSSGAVSYLEAAREMASNKAGACTRSDVASGAGSGP
jgi:hypothetical protein